MTTALAPDLTATSREAMDAAVRDLQEHRRAWTAVPVRERITLLEELTRSFLPVSDRWAAACDRGRRARSGARLSRGGARRALLRAAQPAAAQDRAPGRRDARPAAHPRLGAHAPHGPSRGARLPLRRLGPDLLRRRHRGRLDGARRHRREPAVHPGGGLPRAPAPGGVALVLGAGNVSSIGPMDALYKLFVEDLVVLYKTHPLNAYLAPLMEEGFAPLIERGFLRIVHGGADGGRLPLPASGRGRDPHHRLGPHLRRHRLRHRRGGTAAQGARRAAARQALHRRARQRQPGDRRPRARGRLERQRHPLPRREPGDHAGQQRRVQLQRHAGDHPARRVAGAAAAARRPCAPPSATCPPRKAWYTGAADRFDAFLAAHPEAERFGDRRGEQLPWALIPGVDSEPPGRHRVHDRGVLRRLRRDRPRGGERRGVPGARRPLLQRHALGDAQRHPDRPPGGAARSGAARARRAGDRGSALRHGHGQPLGGDRLRPGRHALGGLPGPHAGGTSSRAPASSTTR